MSTSSLVRALEEALLRMFATESCFEWLKMPWPSLTRTRATLARKGHSVLLLEAGGDHGRELLQQSPGLYVLKYHDLAKASGSHDLMAALVTDVLVALLPLQRPRRCPGGSGLGISATRPKAAETPSSTISFLTAPSTPALTLLRMRSRESRCFHLLYLCLTEF
jgi:hypothetical protein